MSFSISGRTAIVTGAANGVGLAIARHFAREGANVMFADMDEQRLAEEIGEEAAEDDSNIRYFAGDLREKLTVANLLSATLDAFDRVDILVNASRQVELSEPLNPDEDRVEHLLQQNLMTSLRVTQAIAKRMIHQAEKAEDDDRAPGTIINLTSIAARRTRDDLLGFSVSSAALDQLTRSMAIALAPNGIRVNGLAIGSVMSASLQEALNDQDDMRDAVLSGTPLGRIASAAEAAEAAQFLASDGAAFMTGQILTVDGGRTLLDAVARCHH